MTPATQHCGDSCGAVAAMAVAFREYVPPETRMATAIEQVLSGEMSQRGAAKANGVAQQTLSDHLARVTGFGHLTETQSSTEVSKGQQKADKGPTLTKEVVRSRLRAMCRDQGGAPAGVSKSLPEMRGWLKWAGIPIPPELDGKTTPFNPSVTTTAPTPAQKHDTESQRLPANDPLPVFPDRPTETDPEEDAILDERIDLNKLSQQVLSDVISSARSDSFKRAATLATELEQLLCLAFYGKDDWSGQDWVHINGQLKTCQSLAGQRAEEAHREVFHERYPKGGAVAV